MEETPPIKKNKHVYKIVLLGEKSVGKTQIMKRVVNDTFPKTKPTFASDFMSKDLIIEDRKVVYQIWDSEGFEQDSDFQAIFYKRADGCMLIYDSQNLSTFDSLEKLKNEFIEQGCPKNTENFPFFVLGNKCDLQEGNPILEKKVEEWCTLNGLQHYFVSALTNQNLDEAFLALTRITENNQCVAEVIQAELDRLQAIKDQEAREQEALKEIEENRLRLEMEQLEREQSQEQIEIKEAEEDNREGGEVEEINKITEDSDEKHPEQ